MADREDGYHLKKTCINNDVTSNLKQIRKRDAAIKQSKGFISSRSVHPSSFTAWVECFKSTDENDGSSCGPAQVSYLCDFDIGPTPSMCAKSLPSVSPNATMCCS